MFSTDTFVYVYSPHHQHQPGLTEPVNKFICQGGKIFFSENISVLFVCITNIYADAHTLIILNTNILFFYFY